MKAEDISAQNSSAPRIESIRVRNFRLLHDINLKKLSSFAVFVGENGTGKSTFFQVFGFLKSALKGSVDSALKDIGGYQEVAGRGHTDEPIIIKLQFKVPITGKKRLVTYYLEIGNAKNNKPIILREYLSYALNGSSFYLMEFKQGNGYVVKDNDEPNAPGKDMAKTKESLGAPDVLAIKGLGQFKRHKAAFGLRQLIENCHMSNFHITAARQPVKTGDAEHLSNTGDNLPLVVQYLYENKRDVFDGILRKFQKRIPGMSRAEAYRAGDGCVQLRFWDKSFKEPFSARYMSDGTIKMFAYLVLLHDPKPHPFLCVEEPENQLYPDLMSILTEEFRDYGRRGGQVFVSTHSPDFMNEVVPEEAYLMKKKDGESEIYPLSQNEQIVALIEGGDQLGYLWGQGLLQPNTN